MSNGILQDTVMVIGGGNGGIGRAIAARAIEEGAQVVLWDLSAPQAAEGLTFIKVDLTSEEGTAAAYAETIERFGKIDSLVNAAGIIGVTSLVENYPLDDWNRVMSINLTAAFLSSKAVAKHMRARGMGRIVNLSSIAGKEGNAHQAAYSASKAALIALTKVMGKELATSGVLVNCITPAVIQTDLIYQMTDEQRATVLGKIPMGRAGLPEEIAELAVWLASSRCGFSTGATFDASGGRATY